MQKHHFWRPVNFKLCSLGDVVFENIALRPFDNFDEVVLVLYFFCCVFATSINAAILLSRTLGSREVDSVPQGLDEHPSLMHLVIPEDEHIIRNFMANLQKGDDSKAAERDAWWKFRVRLRKRDVAQRAHVPRGDAAPAGFGRVGSLQRKKHISVRKKYKHDKSHQEHLKTITLQIHQFRHQGANVKIFYLELSVWK